MQLCMVVNNMWCTGCLPNALTEGTAGLLWREQKFTPDVENFSVGTLDCADRTQ